MKRDLLVRAFLAGLVFLSAETQAATQDLGVVSLGQSGNIDFGTLSPFPNPAIDEAQTGNSDITGMLAPDTVITFSYSMPSGMWTGGGVSSLLSASLFNSSTTLSASSPFGAATVNAPGSDKLAGFGSVYADLLPPGSGSVVLENLSSQTESFRANFNFAINLGPGPSGTFNVSAVPLPGSLLLFATAFALLVGFAHLKNRRQAWRNS